MKVGKEGVINGKTLEQFGRPGASGKPEALHSCSMRPGH
jgi:hypothetical protein